MPRIVIFGARKFAYRKPGPGNPLANAIATREWEYGYRFLDSFRAILELYDPISTVITGGATGADFLGKIWAEDRRIPGIEIKPEWEDFSEPCLLRYRQNDGKPYNALAGGRRNERMILEGKPDFGIAFPGGSGTADMLKRMKEHRIPVLQPLLEAPRYDREVRQHRRHDEAHPARPGPDDRGEG